MAKNSRKSAKVRVVEPGWGDVKATSSALCVRLQSPRGKREYHVRVPLVLVLGACRKAGVISAKALLPRPASPILKEPRK